MTETEKYSFKGYSLKEWAKHNKDNLKAIVVIIAGYNYLSGFSWQSLGIALLAVVGKLAIDSVDYWLSD